MQREWGIQEYWRALVEAIRNFMRNYSSQELPNEAAYKGKERTFQSCLFHELLLLGVNRQPPGNNIRLEDSCKGSDVEKKWDIVLGEPSNSLVFCLLKTNFLTEEAQKDLRVIENCEPDRVGVFISTGQRGADKEYGEILLAYEESGSVANDDICPLKKGRFRYSSEYGGFSLNRMYLVVNANSI